MSPVHVDDTLKNMETALSDGRPAEHEYRIDKTTTQDQAHSPLTSLKWADEIPNLDIVPQVAARPLSGSPAADKDWPLLPTTDMENYSHTDLQSNPLLMVGIKNQRALTTWQPPPTRLSRKMQVGLK
jgi:hypothetical protein